MKISEAGSCRLAVRGLPAEISDIIVPSSREEIVAAYDFLTQLRLQAQITAIQANRPLTNLIQPSKLGYIQQELLKQAFAQIAAVQKKIGYDFLGGM